MRKEIRIILLFAALLCFCFSTYQVADYMLHTIRTMKMNDELSSLIVDTEPQAEVPSQDAVTQADREYMMEKYGELYHRNPDFIGWLDIEGTEIRYPVMQSVSEPEKYLEQNFDLEPDYAGTLFVDARCNLVPDHISTDTIIYGHHMKNGTMFGELPRFEDADYCQSHSTIRFDTIYRSGTYRLFAVILSQAVQGDPDQEEDAYYNFINAESESSLESYLDSIRHCAIYYDESSEPHFGDEILTLSTCSYHVENGRLALISVRMQP